MSAEIKTPYDAFIKDLLARIPIDKVGILIQEKKREGYLQGVKDTKETWREWLSDRELESVGYRRRS